MANIPLLCDAVESVFSYEPGQTKYNEQLAWELLRNLKQLQANNFHLNFWSTTEQTATDTAFSTFLGEIVSWADACFDAIDAGDAGEEGFRDLPVPLPDAKPVLLLLPPPYNFIIYFLVDLGLKLFERWLLSDSNKELSDLVEVVRRASLDDNGYSFLARLINLGIDLDLDDYGKARHVRASLGGLTTE